MNVLIFGSCVSRDLFNFDTPGLKLVGFFARSSLASAFCPQSREDKYSHALKSSFQRRMVQADFTKEFRKTWPRLSFDVLLLDFIDERFGLFEDDAGRIVTLSNELRKTGCFKDQRGKTLNPYSNDHFALWEKGWSAFVQQLNEHGRLESLRVNRAFWSELTEDDLPLSSVSAEETRTANAYLEKLYRRVQRDIPTRQFLSVEPELFRSKKEHVWGEAPFHYVDAYYLRMIDVLSGATTSNRSAPNLS